MGGMRGRAVGAGLWLCVALCGCVQPKGFGIGGLGSKSSAASGAGTESGRLGAVPGESQKLLAYLASGSYASLPHDATLRAPQGPHGVGGVRIFYEPLLLDSLHAHDGEHPEGAAAVMELFAADRMTRIGWAASVKVDALSDGGFGWFWMEALDRGPSNAPQFVDGGDGLGQCIKCHAGGDDYVLGVPPAAM
jgi:hypothetical protein